MICWFGGLQVGTQEWQSWIILLSNFSFRRNHHTDYTLAKLVGILASITYDSFCLHPLQHLFSFVCLLIAIVTKVTWNVNAAIFISLTVSEIELFYVYWLLALDLLRTVLISITYLLTWLTCWVLWILYIIYIPLSTHIHLHNSFRYSCVDCKEVSLIL